MALRRKTVLSESPVMDYEVPPEGMISAQHPLGKARPSQGWSGALPEIPEKVLRQNETATENKFILRCLLGIVHNSMFLPLLLEMGVDFS